MPHSSQTPPMDAGGGALGSLMDGLEGASTAAVRPPRAPLSQRVRERAGAWWTGRMATTQKRRTTWGVGGAALAMVAVGAFLILRPTPMPDYENDPIDEVFNFTLLSDQFNALPVEKRVELVGKVVERVKNMGSGDSALLAAFAAGIMGKAREQLEANASRLVIDLWDKSATDYANVPTDQRAKYLDKLVVDLIKTTEMLSGNPRDVSDEDRLADAKKQAQRDVRVLSDPQRAPSNTEFARMWVFMDRTVGGHASGGQRARGQQLMRDMTRHLRGMDVHTGKPGGG